MLLNPMINSQSPLRIDTLSLTHLTHFLHFVSRIWHLGFPPASDHPSCSPLLNPLFSPYPSMWECWKAQSLDLLSIHTHFLGDFIQTLAFNTIWMPKTVTFTSPALTSSLTSRLLYPTTCPTYRFLSLDGCSDLTRLFPPFINHI